MLLSHERLINTPVMSLQTGAELARTSQLLIDPRNLIIVAYELTGAALNEHPSFLRPEDVRELSNLGLIVDSSEEFVGLEDVIRIKEVYDFNFNLIGLDVIDDRSKKIGKVQSYTTDAESFSIQQITVKRPMLKSFNSSELLIHRSQILEVTDTHITVQSATQKDSVKETVREFTNPFRAGNVQPDAIDIESRMY